MYWSFWLGALALVAIAVGHWLLVGRMMAVSGRFTALVNRLRFGRTHDVALSDEDVLAALQAATLAEFGDVARADEPEAPVAPAARRPPQTLWIHVIFLVSLAVGGAIAAFGTHDWQLSSSLRSGLFPRFFGGGPLATAGVLVLGGMLVGFGTRMAAGCTSGHGLCGVSRFQRGSLLATACFFGAGIAVSVLIEGIL